MLGLEDNTFYDQLEIIEFTYLSGFSVLLLMCKWFDINPSKKRVKEENNITSINTSLESLKMTNSLLLLKLSKLFRLMIP